MASPPLSSPTFDWASAAAARFLRQHLHFLRFGLDLTPTSELYNPYELGTSIKSS